MKKPNRLISILLSIIMLVSMFPQAVLAEEAGAAQGTAEQSVTGTPVARVGDTEYETLGEILENMEAVEITLLNDVDEDELIVYATTTIHMAGHSITGDVSVNLTESGESLTLENGTVDGTVTVDGGVLIMTAPSDAEAAITKGLNVVSGSAYVSGAQIGVKVSLTFGGDELTISGSDRAVDLLGIPSVNATIYGATDENGDATLAAEFNTENYTYTIYDSIAKKISTKQAGGSQTPDPVPVTIELAPETAEIYGGQSAEFTVSYNGTDALKAYIQKNGQDDTIDAAYDADTGIVTVTTTEEVKAGKYTLYVHEVNNTLIKAKADITVKNVVAKDSNGNYYGDIKTAVEGAADGSTITVVAKEKQISLPDGIYVETADQGITLDLNGHSLDGYSLNVGGLTATSKVRTGKLTVIDSKGGSGAVGVTVRNGGTFIFAPHNVNTTLLQLTVYGGTVELRGGNIAAGKWELYNSIKLSALIPSDKGYAYRLYYGGNLYSFWVTLSEAQNNTASKNLALAVVQCEHEGADENNNCLYCGTALVAKNGSKYYTSLEAAIAAANENDTVTLLKSVDEPCTIEKNMTLDLGGNNNMNSNITIKSGNTLTLAGEGIVNVVQTGHELPLSGQTEKDLIGGALDVLSDEVIVNFLSVQQIPKPEMNLSKGTFWKIELPDNLKDMKANELLAEGYAFASTGSGNVVNGYVYRLDNVKVVSHTQHDTTTDNKCVCGYTCDHSNGFTKDGKCLDCGVQCQASVVDKTGAVLQYYVSLQDAIKAHNALANDMVMLLTDANGSYTVDEGQLRMNLNGHTVQSLSVTGSGSLALQGLDGKIQNLTFNGAEARFASSAWPVLGQISITGGASWSSILPNASFGYKIHNDDESYKWYDSDTVAGAAESGEIIKNVSIQTLPVSVPTLTFNKEPVADGDTISVYKPYTFGVNLDTKGANCIIYYKFNGETRGCPALYRSEGYYESEFHDSKFGTTGSFEIWTVITKDGYTRTSDTLTVNIGKADLSEAKITLKNGGKLKCGAWTRDIFNELTMEIDSVTYFGKALTTDDYTIVRGNKGTTVGDYTLEIEAKENSDFVGSASASWEMLPCELTVPSFPVQVKPYDGTTDITLENSVFGNGKINFYCPSHGSGSGCGIELIKDTDYEIEIVSNTFSEPDANSEGTVTYIIKLLNPNFTFDAGDTKEFTTDHEIVIAEKLPEGYEPDEGTLAVRNGVKATYTFDVSEMLKELPGKLRYNGEEKDTIYYLNEYGNGASLVSLDGNYYTEGTASIDENGKLTLHINEVNATKEGSIGTVKVRVRTQNYDDFYVTVNVMTANRIVPTGEPTLDKDAITYGEPINSIGLSGTMNDDVNKVEVSGEFTWNGDPTYVLPAGIVRVGWTFTPDDAVTYASVQGTSVFTVNKAAMPEDAITTVPEAISDLVYQIDVSTPQTLHTGGQVRDNLGTMKYTLGDPESADTVWSEEPITSRNAGEFTVYYKIFGDDNHLDSAYGEIKCSIAKYELTYSVVCLPKVYDGTTVGDPKRVDNVKFYSNDISSKEITGFVNGTDYTVDKIEYKSANVGGNLGTLPVDATATLSLIGDAAVNYKLADNGKASGLITPASFTGIDFNSYTYEICYGETTPRSVTLTYFGAPDKLNYEIYSDMVVSSNDILSKIDLVNDSYFTFAVKEGLKGDAVGKSVTVKFNIYSKDHNYRSEELTFTVKLIDKATPKLYVNPVSAVYNGKPVPASLIDGKATIDGHEISGTWSWENDESPTYVSESREYTAKFEPTYSHLYYGATEKVKVTVTPRDIGDKDIFLPSGDSFVYTGKPIIPKIYGEYKYDEKMEPLELVEDKDYTLTYPEDAINVGKKTITVTGYGNFGGTTELEYEITPCTQTPLIDLELPENGYVYDGTDKTPSVTVKVNGTVLTEGKDYEVSYKNNKNAGTASVMITSKGNYEFSEFEKEFTINKANIKVKPKDVTKTYGKEAAFALEYDSELITYEELMQVTNPVFTSDGATANAPVNETGYEISVLLTNNETDNLTFAIDGAGMLKVEKAPLTIKVKDVNREYGAENPELSVSYDGFVNGEDESVLGGTLVLRYNDEINETANVGLHENVTTASGLTSENYDIEYIPGNVTIAKIPVNASAGTASRSYFNVEFDKSLEGLSTKNFIVKDSEGNTVTVTNITASSDGKNYTLSGNFEVGKEYTVKVVLSGASVDATHQLATDEFVITPIRTGGGGGGTTRYTVSFETNGGSKLSKQTVSKNTVIKEPAAPEKEGYDFAGWYTDKELKEKYDFSAKVTKNITLYAAWTEKDNSANQIILTIGEKDALVFGTKKTNDVAPKIVNDRTMLPARFVAENLGADVSWDEDKRLVTICGKNLKTGEDITIRIYIGSAVAYVNDKEINLDSAAFIENDRTYTPVRFISEELGASVEWIESEQKVVITR